MPGAIDLPKPSPAAQRGGERAIDKNLARQTAFSIQHLLADPSKRRAFEALLSPVEREILRLVASALQLTEQEANAEEVVASE